MGRFRAEQDGRVVSVGPVSDSQPSEAVPPGLLGILDAVAAEIETFVDSAGWDRPAALFALVPTALVAAAPEGARLLGLTATEPIAPDSLTPVAQDDLPDEPLDEALAGIEWPAAVTGCALTQEILILPPEADGFLDEDRALAEAAAHPDRREARLVVAVLRDGRTACVLRVRARSGDEVDQIAFGADLAPNLSAALHATLL